MGEKRLLRVICYDIPSDTARARIATRLEEIAVRVQDSVFEARLTQPQTDGLFEELRTLAAAEGNVRIYTIADGSLGRCRQAGGPAILGGGRYWLV